jgi:hypothetical protein
MKRSATNYAGVILIAPPSIAWKILKPTRIRMLYFASLDEFKRWQRAPTQTRFALGDLVDRAIKKGRVRAVFPEQLELAFAWLRCQETVPVLKAFAFAASSRRSFFRHWAACMGISPTAFLFVLRALHVERLLQHRVALDAVLHAAGCKSLMDLRRYLRHQIVTRGTTSSLLAQPRARK